MVPMEFHDTSFYRGNKHFGIKEEVIPKMKEYYQNVSERFYYLFLAYAVMNFFEVIYNSMLLIFKGNKGLLKNMEKIDLVMPILMLAWIITFICESMKTTSRVCFCIYKDAFYDLKEAKMELEPLAKLRVPREDYMCKPDLATSVLEVTIFECVFTGLWFITLIYVSVKNNLDIKFKQDAGVVSASYQKIEDRDSESQSFND